MKVFQVPMLAMSLVGLGLLSGLDAPPARADFTFGAPVNIQSDFPFLDIATDYVDCFSADGLEMYFESPRAGGQGDPDIWVSKRASIQDDWGPPENLGATVNSVSTDMGASISADGLSLYFTRGAAYPAVRLYVAKRATKQDNWGTPVSVGAAVNTADAVRPCISADELELYFESGRPGGQGNVDMWVTTRATVNDEWGPPVNLGPTVNSPNWDGWPSISPDGLLLFLCSNRPGAHPWGDIHVARRASRSAPWQPAVNLGPIVNATCWNAPLVSADGSALYIRCDPKCDMTSWIYKAPILPIVDFNSDEMVDIEDLVMLIEHWGQANSQCDIGPMPWGDGKVDANDLEVLMSYWGQEILDPASTAYWRLDETEGAVAADSIGTSDGTLAGEPLWQPTGGKIGGALQFDGSNDYVATGFAWNPTQSPFSVFAWVKGDAPAQVILSQKDGANWLMAKAATGALTTDLKSGLGGKSLSSSAVITDGQWHRVGFVRDGTSRILYVDGVEVAKDTQSGIAGSTNGLYIGAGSKLATGTFWSGLIDEVRIYNRVVQP